MKCKFLILFLLLFGCVPQKPEEIPYANLSEMTIDGLPKDCDIYVRMYPAVLCSNWKHRYFWVHGYSQRSSTTKAYYGLDVNQSWRDKWFASKDKIDNITLNITCNYQWAKRHGKKYKSFVYVMPIEQFESILLNGTDIPKITKKHFIHLCTRRK